MNEIANSALQNTGRSGGISSSRDPFGISSQRQLDSQRVGEIEGVQNKHMIEISRR